MTRPRTYAHPKTGKPLARYAPPDLWREEKFHELLEQIANAPVIPEHLIDRYARNRLSAWSRRKTAPPPLTEKQRWILQGLAEGKTQKQLAFEWQQKKGLTGKHHHANFNGTLMQALGRLAASTPTEAVAIALGMGLIELPKRIAGSPGPALLTSAEASRVGADLLTTKERQVLRLLANGLENSEIAQEVSLGVETVKTHVSHLLAKYGARNRTHLAALAVRMGHIH